MTEPITTLLHRALASGSKSTVLKPLAWLIGLCATSGIASFRFDAPYWLGALFGGLGILSIVLYLSAYVYFALTDRDSLRSEKYSIQKLAIKKGFIGDDISGYMRLPSKEINADIEEVRKPVNKEDEE